MSKIVPAANYQISIQRMVCTGCGAEANAACNCGLDYKPKAVRAREAVEANPEKSDRAIAKETGISQPTISKARTDNNLSVDKRTGLDGKTRKLPRKADKVEPARKLTKAEIEFHEKRERREAKMLADWLADHPSKTLADAEIAGTCGDENLEASEKWMIERYGGRDPLDCPGGAIDDAAVDDAPDEPEEDAVAELASIRKDHVYLLDDYWKLKDRNTILTAALNVKEAQEGRNWPADMKPRQIKKRDDCLRTIAAWQRDLEQLYGEVTGQPCWRVEVTTKDGRRMGTGARFGTRGEAEFYNAHFAPNQLKGDYAGGKIIPCENEKANVLIEGDSLRFSHGDCVLLKWQSLTAADPAPIPGDLSIPEFMQRQAP
jgi:hypothetical protein